MLSTICALSYSTLTTALRSRGYISPIFTEEETIEQLSNLPKVTQLGRGRTMCQAYICFYSISQALYHIYLFMGLLSVSIMAGALLCHVHCPKLSP